MQALRSGADPKGYDESGFSPLHWAAAPDEGMPGDTIARRACIAILARLGDVDAPDQTALGLRAVQWCVTKNYVGCIKTFAHVNADLSGTIHWAVSNKAHACVRELMRLGVAAKCHKDLWDGMTPLMLAATPKRISSRTHACALLLTAQWMVPLKSAFTWANVLMQPT